MALEKQVAELLEINARLQEENQALKDEIARLKGHKPKPEIKPSALEPSRNRPERKRPDSTKKTKIGEIKIHNTHVVPPKEQVPDGSRFKGYTEFTVVGLKFEAHNVRYKFEVWETPDGRLLRGELPPELKQLRGHFSPELVSFIQYQHHHAHVPQHLILEQLHDIGVSISEGQLSRILLDKSSVFHPEKDALLPVALEVSAYIHTDDTGARHKGHNGYCTHIGNQLFTYFMSTDSKSRLNFLNILRAGHTDYVIDGGAIDYMREQKLPPVLLKRLEGVGDLVVHDDATWAKQLQDWDIHTPRHVKIVTEGALLSSIVSHGLHPNLVILSDDAGQFNILAHALCWIHAERTLAKLIGFTDVQREALETKRSQVWDFYRDLKAYKENPTVELKKTLGDRFDIIFQEKTCFTSLDHALERLFKNKAELLLVLKRPDIPLHNNLSENDIREYVTRRKRSGSTRSDLGRRCRDTFASLKKTCRKLGISFWHYLVDRNSGSNTIPKLSQLVRDRAMAEAL